ncbi:MAG: LytR/AlgR family response regulator transcription factor [Saprospiraceae bacterium]
MPIRCLIVDDEPPALDLLKTYAGMIEQLEVVATSQSAVKAFDILKNETIDLLFLDIQMPVLNGIDFIKTLQQPPAIILTTAYREYALDGYDLDIIDYLLKPIAFNRFLKAVDRYNSRMQTAVAENVSPTPPPPDEHYFFNVGRTHHKVLLNDILYLESLKDYTRIHTSTERLVVKGNIGSTLKQLPDAQFVRIHRSFAIALAHLQTYNQTAVEIAGKTLPIGISYREGFMQRI